MRRLVPILSLMMALAGAAGVAQKLPDKKKFPVLSLEGKPAPDFKVDFALNGGKVAIADLAGKVVLPGFLEKAPGRWAAVVIADLAGKVVLLDFWAVFAPPSRAALPRLAKLHKDHADKGLEVIGLTRYYAKYDFKGGKLVNARKPLAAEQEQEMLTAFAAYHKIPYRIIVSPDAVFNYKVTSMPVAVLIDKKGVVRMVKIGYSPENVKALDAKIKELAEEK